MRTLDAAIAEAVVIPVVRTIILARIHFDSGVIAWHSGFGDLLHEGYTYKGIGNVGSISAVKEEPGVKSASLNLVVNGIRPENVALFLTEPFMNRKAFAHMQLLDDQDRPLTATPLLLFRGTLDGIDGNMGKSASFQVAIKSRLADWQRPRRLRYTDADQQKLHPGDQGMEYIPQMAQRQLIWPKAAFLPDPRD